MFGAFVSSVGFKFSAIRGAVLFDFLGLFLGKLGFRGSLVFDGVEVGFFLALLFFSFFLLGKFGFTCEVDFFRFVFIEIGAANEGIGFGVVRSFLVFCFGQFEREGGGLLIVQFRFAAHGRGIRSRRDWLFKWRSHVS